MAESSEVQALEKISTEVGESQIKITLSSQCIKAQAFLADKLKKQIERQKEICNIICSNNFKLQNEIKQAELEIQSLIIAHETIKSGNIELKKELLLAKEKKVEIIERIANGEKKYEALWLESKERYEGLPFVQKLLQATSKTQVLKETIVELGNQSQSLSKEYNTKKDFITNMERKRVIELANYLVNVLPSAIKGIQDKNATIKCLIDEIESIEKDQENTSKNVNSVPEKQMETNSEESKKAQPVDDGWLNISSNIERDIIMMPRLHFMNTDFDAINAKLDQIKIMKVDIQHITPSKRTNPVESVSDFGNKKIKDDEFSVFFNNNNIEKKKNKDDTYSRKKLINILEDVKLDKNDVYDMVAKVNIEKLKGVNTISENKIISQENFKISDEKDSEVIEEIDLTKSPSVKNTSILIPPSQFLDLSQDKKNSNSQVEVIVHMSLTESPTSKMSQSLKNSQESNKKRVSFDLPISIEELTTVTSPEVQEHQNNNSIANETIDSQIDISLTSDESYSKFKDMILKKHNLDMSPQFTYAKSKLIQMNNDENIITSKFFQNDKNNAGDENMQQKKTSSKYNDNQTSNINDTENINKEPMEIDPDPVTASSPKASQGMKMDQPVAGLLFNHGTQGIPDSLNVSMSTTGFEDGDPDFPHCIDSSLLLSPKADIPMPMSGDNPDVTSQEVPNFLAGLRKTGLSFFGQSASTDSKPDTSGQNQGNNFNFNFGGGEQKSRGGLFSMFN